MSRDGSSGGVIRLAVITEQGVQRIFVPGDQVPGMVYSLVVSNHPDTFLLEKAVSNILCCEWSLINSPLGGLNNVDDRRGSNSFQNEV